MDVTRRRCRRLRLPGNFLAKRPRALLSGFEFKVPSYVRIFALRRVFRLGRAARSQRRSGRKVGRGLSERARARLRTDQHPFTFERRRRRDDVVKKALKEFSPSPAGWFLVANVSRVDGLGTQIVTRPAGGKSMSPKSLSLVLPLR